MLILDSLVSIFSHGFFICQAAENYHELLKQHSFCISSRITFASSGTKNLQPVQETQETRVRSLIWEDPLE